MSELRASIAEHTGSSADELSSDVANAVDPMPQVLPPEGVTVVRLSDIAAAASTQARVDIAGVRGAADALVIAALARSAPVVAVSEDGDTARKLAVDVRFLLGKTRDDDEMAGEADVLVLPSSAPS